ncbi:MAG: FUSC family protein [Proteobacteria bacterium]|nr:FUSC family protein [Pseudomonadota bacterium]
MGRTTPKPSRLSRLLRSAPSADLARLPIALNLRALSIAEGLRAALSVAVIVGLSGWLDEPQLLSAALGALLTCLCDIGGPIRRRVPVLLGFAVLGGLTLGLGGLARAAGVWVALPAGVFGLFCMAFARVWGQAAMQMGGLLSSVLVLSLDRALPVPLAALNLGLLFFSGGLWAALLTLVIWQLHPSLPARRAVAGAYRALADLVADLRALIAEGVTDEAAWERHARAHRRGVRDAIETARAEMLDATRVLGASNNRSAQSMIRLEAVDQIFGALIALSEMLEQHTAIRPECDRLLRRLRPLLIVLGAGIVDDAVKIAPLNRSIALLEDDLRTLPEAVPERAIFASIVERLQIAATLAVPDNYMPGAWLDGRPPPLAGRLMLPLKANLAWDSLALRHALRAAAVAAPALAYTLIWYNPYAHWLTITIIATMQPYYAATFTRAVERIGGTVLGGVVAALVGLVCRTPLAMTIALFPLCMAAMAVRTVNFGLFMAGLTPLVVLLVEVGDATQSEWTVLAMRTGFTLAGGLLALAGCYALWPSWEPARVRREVMAAIAAHAAYAEAELSFLLGEADAAAVERARRAAGLASNNVEASVSRALLEPGQATRDRLEAALVIDAALRRFAGRVSAMQLDPALCETLPPATWRAWRDWIAGSMRGLAGGQARLAPRPPLQAGPRAEALQRIARQIELMAAVVDRAVVSDNVGKGATA